MYSVTVRNMFLSIEIEHNPTTVVVTLFFPSTGQRLISISSQRSRFRSTDDGTTCSTTRAYSSRISACLILAQRQYWIHLRSSEGRQEGSEHRNPDRGGDHNKKQNHEIRERRKGGGEQTSSPGAQKKAAHCPLSRQYESLAKHHSEHVILVGADSHSNSN